MTIRYFFYILLALILNKYIESISSQIQWFVIMCEINYIITDKTTSNTYLVEKQCNVLKKH